MSENDLNARDTHRHAIAKGNLSRYLVRPDLAATALAMGLILGGCGHEDSTTAKPTAGYQGKPDTAPWDGNRWHGDHESWERAIAARGQNQNEYVRIP